MLCLYLKISCQLTFLQFSMFTLCAHSCCEIKTKRRAGAHQWVGDSFTMRQPRQHFAPSSMPIKTNQARSLRGGGGVCRCWGWGRSRAAVTPSNRPRLCCRCCCRRSPIVGGGAGVARKRVHQSAQQHPAVSGLECELYETPVPYSRKMQCNALILPRCDDAIFPPMV